jgi:hypothetical protein
VRPDLRLVLENVTPDGGVDFSCPDGRLHNPGMCLVESCPVVSCRVVCGLGFVVCVVKRWLVTSSADVCVRRPCDRVRLVPPRLRGVHWRRRLAEGGVAGAVPGDGAIVVTTAPAVLLAPQSQFTC